MAGNRRLCVPDLIDLYQQIPRVRAVLTTE
jgi:hypothetical protein